MTEIKTTTANQITAEVRTITPDQAMDWLTDPQYKAPNRKPRKAKVAAYANDMRNGRWLLTGEPIKFDKDGRLLDGQHRLQAVIDADTPVDMFVVTGLEASAQDVMDTGVARKAGDMLAIHGVDNYNAQAAAAKILSAYKNGTLLMGRSSATGSHSEILQFVTENPLLGELIEECGPLVRKISIYPSAYWVALFLMAEVDRDAAVEFTARLSSGVGLGASDPIYVLREKLILVQQRRERHAPPVLVSLILRCFNAWRAGQTVQRIQLYGKNGGFIAIPEVR